MKSDLTDIDELHSMMLIHEMRNKQMFVTKQTHLQANVTKFEIMSFKSSQSSPAQSHTATKSQPWNLHKFLSGVNGSNDNTKMMNTKGKGLRINRMIVLSVRFALNIDILLLIVLNYVICFSSNLVLLLL